MKKEYESGRCVKIQYFLLKMLIIMKMVVIIVCGVSLLSSYGKSYSQNAKLTFDFENTSIETVLQYIEDRSDYSFMYDNNKIDVTRKVDIRVKDEPISSILDQLFRNEVSYQLIGKHVIITPVLADDQFVNVASQQQKKVTGNVTDESGEPIPGASVVVKGTTIGTVTDTDGSYSISNVRSEATLVFSFVGMKTEEITVASRTTINMVMTEETVGIEEVVAIGYGTLKRSHFTGAMSSMDFEKLGIEDLSSDRIEKALYGKLAGVEIRDVEGQVGVAPEIRIRGTTSFSASTSPLIVIDGMPSAGGDLNDIDMGDVERIEVLKDAASTAIYGSRGSNGVILITSKSGANKRPEFRLKIHTGISDIIRYYDVLSVEELARVTWETEILAPWETGFLKEGLDIPSPVDESGNPVVSPNNKTYILWEDYYSNKTNPATGTVYNGFGAGYYNLNRLNEITNAPTPQESVTNAGVNQSLSLSMSGSNSKTDYYISGIYRYQKGVMINNDFNSISFTSNINTQIKKNLKIEVSLKPSYQKVQTSANTQMGGALRWITHPLYHDEYTLRAALRTTDKPAGYVAPWIEVGDLAKSRDFARTWIMNDDFTDYVLDAKGNKIMGRTMTVTGAQTSYAYAQDTENINTDYRVIGNFALNWTLFKDLVFKTSISTLIRFNKYDYWTGSFINSAGLEREGYGSARYRNNFYRNIINENTLSYAKLISNHNLSFLMGVSFEDYLYTYLDARGRFFENDIIRSLNNAGEIQSEYIGSGKSDEGLVSMFGRFNYSYGDKYLLSIVLRRDGSSQFGPDKRWGSFPSISAGWRLNEEKLFKSVKWLNELRVRASYGITGNNRITRYSYVTPLNLVKYVIGSEIVNGYATNSGVLGNQNIGWEQTNAVNFGLSVGVLQNKYSFEVDLYQNKTKSLLLENPIASISGYDAEWENVGQVRSKGIEFQINTVHFNSRKFYWGSSLNFGRNINELIDYGGTDEQFIAGYSSSAYRLKIGRPLGEFYGYKTNGEIWKSTTEVNNAIQQKLAYPSTVPGDLKLVDLNGDGELTTDDKTSIGSPYPDFEWGINNIFKYKNFDLNFTFQGSHGSEVYNLSSFLGYATLRWLNENKYKDEFHGETPLNPASNAISETDYYVEDASYIALRDVTLGYKFAKSKFRLYLSGSNLLYLMADGYHGINPEYAAKVGGLFYGEQRYNTTALSRTIILGLDLRF